MQDLNLVDGLQSAGGWLVRNQTLILGYIVNLAAAMLILVFGFIIARVISNGFNTLLRNRNLDPTVAGFLSMLVRYSIIAFTLIAALSRVGVQTASVIAVLGAVGLAVGLSLQNSLSNLAAGVLIVTFRPMRVGEYVDIGGTSGTVVSIQIFSTSLKTSDGKIVVIPNGSIIAGKIINYSREPIRRNEFIIGVDYSADVDKVIAILRAVAESHPHVLKEQAVVVALNEMAPSSLNFIVRCWSESSNLQQVYWDLMANFKRELDANKIGIPYPQMDVRIIKTEKDLAS